MEMVGMDIRKNGFRVQNREVSTFFPASKFWMIFDVDFFVFWDNDTSGNFLHIFNDLLT